jgi:hypothetical protein
VNEDVEAPPSAADALAIIERERTRAHATMAPDLVVLHGVWGLAYLLGGTAYWLHATGALGGATTAALAIGLGVAAAAASTVVSVRGSRGVRGPRDPRAAMHGLAWPVALVLAYALAVGLSPEGDERGAVIATTMVFVVGVLYLMTGAVWSAPPQYVAGLWTMGVAVAAAFTPAPAFVLVLSLGAGGAFVALAAWYRARNGRP